MNSNLPANMNNFLANANKPDLLKVENLQVKFFTRLATITAVDGVTFSIQERETLGLVGESGSGKSATCRSIMRLVQRPGKIVGGKIIYDSQDILKLSERELNNYRGKEVSMIFQDPMTALNPVLRIRDQMIETLEEDRNKSAQENLQTAITLMKLVGIPIPERRLNEYPHQFSGGMRQRVMIAIAISRKPRLLLADEPTTAVDVTIQDQILKLLLRLQREFGMSLLLVTHDLGIVAQTCDRVAVMYAGRIVEMTDTLTLFKNFHHPYTMGLMNSVPTLKVSRQRLIPIPGMPPDMANLPDGCRFHPRCQFATDECRSGDFPLRQVGKNHFSACIKDVR